MAKVYRNPTVQWYKDQIGYSSGSSKSSKFSKTLDSVNWYNSRKNGYANWCAIMYDCGIYENASDYDSIDEVKEFVFEPSRDNCGAGCKQKVDYYKSVGMWIDGSHPEEAMCGDEIFFWSPDYVSSSNPYGVYHTGAIIDWGIFDEGEGFKTSEGNTNGTGDVSERFYSYGDKRILGFGRPAWTADDPEDVKPAPEPTPEPTPEPSPDPDRPPYLYRVVNINSFLRVRSEPNTHSEIIGKLYNNDEVYVWETRDGWAKVDETKEQWCSLDYLEKI